MKELCDRSAVRRRMRCESRRISVAVLENLKFSSFALLQLRSAAYAGECKATSSLHQNRGPRGLVSRICENVKGLIVVEGVE